MKSGFDSIKDIAEFFSYIVTTISLIGLWVTFILSRKQIHFSTMEKCINDFREIMKYSSDSPDEIDAKQYIDLVNEELFYLENNYLPLEVAIEWIDGMIDFLPFSLLKSHEFQKSETFKKINTTENANELLKNYPRVMKVIQLNDNICFNKIHLEVGDEKNRQGRREERDKLIFCMISKLNISFFIKLKFKRAIACR
jgi:hypothetical protein